MTAIARLLVLVGGAGVAASAFLPWVTVEGVPLSIDLDWLGADVSPASKTVAGTETAAWPVVTGVGAVVVVLALLNLARRLLVLLGLVTVVAGAGLLYYVMNVIDIETSGRSVIERALADAVLSSSAGAGPFVLLVGGLCILVGALMR